MREQVKSKFARRARAQFRKHWRNRIVQSPTYQIGFALGIAFSVAQQAKREHPSLLNCEVDQLLFYLQGQVEALLPPEVKQNGYYQIGREG